MNQKEIIQVLEATLLLMDGAKQSDIMLLLGFKPLKKAQEILKFLEYAP